MYGRRAFAEAGVTLHNTTKYVDHPLTSTDRVGVVHYLAVFGTDTNIPSSKNIIAFHLIPAAVSVDTIKLFQHKGMSFSLADTEDCTPLHVSGGCGNVLSKICAALKNTKNYVVTPLMVTAQRDKV